MKTFGAILFVVGISCVLSFPADNNPGVPRGKKGNEASGILDDQKKYKPGKI